MKNTKVITLIGIGAVSILLIGGIIIACNVSKKNKTMVSKESESSVTMTQTENSEITQPSTSESTSETGAETASESAPETETTTESQPAPQPTPEPAPTPEPEPQPAPTPQPTPEPAPAPQPTPTPEPVPTTPTWESVRESAKEVSIESFDEYKGDDENGTFLYTLNFDNADGTANAHEYGKGENRYIYNAAGEKTLVFGYYAVVAKDEILSLDYCSTVFENGKLGNLASMYIWCSPYKKGQENDMYPLYWTK